MLNLPIIEVPIVTGPTGIAYVKGTEVHIEDVISAYEDGESAEDIAAAHEGLRLTDVYLVISFYLKNRHDVEVYLAGRQHRYAA
jgi:uncharacterized protein (DUF433 family)